MLPIALIVAILAGLMWLDSRKDSGSSSPQVGDGKVRRTLTKGTRYRFTIYIRPPFATEAAAQQIMNGFAAMQPPESSWQLVSLVGGTIDGKATSVLTYEATQVKSLTVGLPLEMGSFAGVSMTLAEIREV